jgi:succinate-semialdehyde dehydrogenase / glutarate-semialdehyde dehydrogenase
MKSINPATGEVLASFETLNEAAIEQRLTTAVSAFHAWKQRPFDERSKLMLRAAETLEGDAAKLGRLITLEMGRPLQPAVDEILKCARGCRYYAENTTRFLADEEIKTEAARSFVRYEPVGVVLAIMPWNFPFWQVFRFAAPAIMAGNVALLKHASNVPQAALAIEEIFTRAGFPSGVFQTLLIPSSRVPTLIDDERINAVTLTGSEGAGRDVASRAGRMIKKTVLELGGSDPFIVMPSADLERAVATAVKARTVNNGQSCIAAKRFIVADPIADEFLERFSKAMSSLKVGDPLDPQTEIGPLATPTIAEELEAQVRATVDAGGRVVSGGGRLKRPGNFFAPTVLTDIPPASPAYKEELFGPVASVFRVPDVEAALRIANDSPFGLGASVWTNDQAERARFIAGLETGQVFVNAMVASDPRVPFGGVKRSGYGRELSVHGIREFVNAKTVWIA